MKKDHAYEKIREQVIAEAKMMRVLNRQIPTKGERFDLPLEDREINIVYFRAQTERAPLVVGFHGGGFLFGGSAMDDDMWLAVRDRLDVNLASVEYRKSPDFGYREALDDAYDASVYLKEHAAEFGFDGERISVMGCSAGANLAAAVCIYAKQKGGISFQNQILIYPFLDAYTDPDEKGSGEEDPLMHIFNELHCPREEAKQSLVSPVFAAKEELYGLPRAVFVMADRDNLKYEGYAYARMLEEAGVPVAKTECAGMPHAFFENGFGKVNEQSLAALGPEAAALAESGEIARASEKALEFVAENSEF